MFNLDLAYNYNRKLWGLKLSYLALKLAKGTHTCSGLNKPKRLVLWWTFIQSRSTYGITVRFILLLNTICNITIHFLRQLQKSIKNKTTISHLTTSQHYQLYITLLSYSFLIILLKKWNSYQSQSDSLPLQPVDTVP